MFVDTPAGRKWHQLVLEIARTQHLEPEAITADSTVVDDLGLDSLDIAELVVFLQTELGFETTALDLELVDWRRATLGQLFQECLNRATT